MYNFDKDFNVRSGYVANHVPQVFTMNEFGGFLYGEDPGNIQDEIDYTKEVEKLTR